MKKVKIVEQEIRLSSILALDIEVNGFTQRDREGNPIYNIPGIINQKLDAKTKYWLGKLSKFLEKENKNYADLRNDLIKKYGEEKDDENGNPVFGVSPTIPDPDFKSPKPKKGEEEIKAPMINNPNLEKFRNEEIDLLKQKVKVSLPKFDIEELFRFETEYVYTTAGELLIQDDDSEFKYSDLEYPEENEAEISNQVQPEVES